MSDDSWEKTKLVFGLTWLTYLLSCLFGLNPF